MGDLIFTVEENAHSRFGLKVCDREGNLYRYYASVSDSKDELEALAARCRAFGVSPLHIDDIICDFLCQLSEV